MAKLRNTAAIADAKTRAAFGRDGIYSIDGPGQNIRAFLVLIVIASGLLCTMLEIIMGLLILMVGPTLYPLWPGLLVLPPLVWVFVVGYPAYKQVYETAMHLLKSSMRIATAKADFLEDLIEQDVESYMRTKVVPLNYNDNEYLVTDRAESVMEDQAHFVKQSDIELPNGHSVPRRVFIDFLQLAIDGKRGFDRVTWVGQEVRGHVLRRQVYDGMMAHLSQYRIIKGRTTGVTGECTAKSATEATTMAGLD